MVYAAKRSKNRCPTHPGALLRDDIIPATAGPRPRSPACSEFRASTSTTSWENESRYLPPSPRASASFSAMAPGSGPGCRAPMIFGTRNGPRMSVAFLPSRPEPPETGPGKRRFPSNFHRKAVPIPVSWPSKPCYRAGLNSLGTRYDRPSAPCNPRFAVRF
jgi:hypothetical protein